MFDAISTLASRGVAVELVTTLEQVTAMGKSVGGMAWLIELTHTVSSAAHLRHHTKIVHETSLLRKLIRESGEIIAQAYETRPDGDGCASWSRLPKTACSR